MEIKDQVFDKENIRQVIMAKAWYDIDPNTGAFNWQRSVEKIAQSFSLSPENVGRAMIESFSPDCLIKVNSYNDQGQEIEEPLIKVVVDLGLPVYIWTVGDVEWQRTKFERAGTKFFIPDDRFICSANNKIDCLRDLIEGFKRSVKFGVVDDKRSNIEAIKRLNDELKTKGSVLLDYYFNNNDPNADANAFLGWLKKQIASQEIGGVILDFDGVVVDTDSVLKGPFVDRIFGFLR